MGDSKLSKSQTILDKKPLSREALVGDSSPRIQDALSNTDQLCFSEKATEGQSPTRHQRNKKALNHFKSHAEVSTPQFLNKGELSSGLSRNDLVKSVE